MVITYSIILLGLLALFRPLQRNRFYILHAALVIGAAYYIETHWFRASVFGSKTLLLFIVFQLVSINIVTFIAYGVDKRAAVRGAWRIPEADLHALEFLGGWSCALVAQRFFKHKTKKKSFRTDFYLVILAELVVIGLILHFLGFF